MNFPRGSFSLIIPPPPLNYSNQSSALNPNTGVFTAARTALFFVPPSLFGGGIFQPFFAYLTLSVNLAFFNEVKRVIDGRLIDCDFFFLPQPTHQQRNFKNVKVSPFFYSLSVENQDYAGSLQSIMKPHKLVAANLLRISGGLNYRP